jgi:hypothetical protein
MSAEKSQNSSNDALASLSDAEKSNLNLKDYPESGTDTPKNEPATITADPIQPTPATGSAASEPDVEALPPPVLDWDGPDDPDNPLNWGLAWRVYHSAVPALLCFAVYAVPCSHHPNI